MKANGSGRKRRSGRIKHFLDVWLPLNNTVAVVGLVKKPFLSSDVLFLVVFHTTLIYVKYTLRFK